MARKLTPKQEKFAQLYVELGNASEAYRRAGYRCSSSGVAEASASRLLRNDKVANRVAVLTQRAGKKTEVTRERIINKLAEFAFPEAGSEIKERDSIKALELLGKRFALWIERHQQDGPGWEAVFRMLSPETQQLVLRDLEEMDVPDVGAVH